MKKLSLIIAILVLLSPLYTQRQRKEDISPIAQQIDEMMNEAVTMFEMGRAGEGAALLLDTVFLVKPRSAWPEGFVDAVENAKYQFRGNDLAGAVVNITKALSLLKPNQRIPEEGGGGQIANIAAILHGNILAAKEHFISGNAEQGVIVILEALQLLAPIR